MLCSSFIVLCFIFSCSLFGTSNAFLNNINIYINWKKIFENDDHYLNIILLSTTHCSKIIENSTNELSKKIINKIQSIINTIEQKSVSGMIIKSEGKLIKL